MGVKVRFGCEHCDARADGATQRTLERSLRDRTIGSFFDAQPGGWLIWTGGGAFGSRQYACAEHRADLVARVRRHHGGRGSGVWEQEPYAALWPHGYSGFDEREVAALLGATRRQPGDRVAGRGRTAPLTGLRARAAELRHERVERRGDRAVQPQRRPAVPVVDDLDRRDPGLAAGPRARPRA